MTVRTFMREMLVNGVASSSLTPGRFRNALLRRAGFDVPPTVHLRPDVFIPITRELSIGPGSLINAQCVFEGHGRIDIGRRVFMAVGVTVLTDSHEMGPAEQRAGTHIAKPVVIGDGVWIGARAVIFPGVTIGPGSVVAAGSVVRQDVLPNTLVAGVPARVIRELP